MSTPYEKLKQKIFVLKDKISKESKVLESNFSLNYDPQLVSVFDSLLFVSDFERGYFQIPKETYNDDVAKIEDIVREKGYSLHEEGVEQNNFAQLIKLLSRDIFGSNDANHVSQLISLIHLSKDEIKRMVESKLKDERRRNESPEETERRKINELREKYPNFETLPNGRTLNNLYEGRFGFQLQTTGGLLFLFVDNKSNFTFCELWGEGNLNLNNFPFALRVRDLGIIHDSWTPDQGYVYEKFSLYEYGNAYDVLDSVMAEFVRYRKEGHF